MPRRRAQLVGALSAAVMLLSAPAVMAQQQEVRSVPPGNLLAALANTSAEIQALSSLDAESIRVVTVEVGDLLSGHDVQGGSNALNWDQANILALQHFLSNHQTAAAVAIRNSLIRNQLVVNEVVAIDVLTDGEVILFYRLVEPGRMHKV